MELFDSELRIVPTTQPNQAGNIQKLVTVGDPFDPVVRFEIASPDELDVTKHNPLSPFDTQLTNEGLVRQSHALRNRVDTRRKDRRDKMSSPYYTGIIIEAVVTVTDFMISYITSTSPPNNYPVEHLQLLDHPGPQGYLGFCALTIAGCVYRSRSIGKKAQKSVDSAQQNVYQVEAAIGQLRTAQAQDEVEAFQSPDAAEVAKSIEQRKASNYQLEAESAQTNLRSSSRIKSWLIKTLQH